jgi:conjugal transfer pilus assembly protein TraB
MGPSIRDRASTLIERMSPRARQWATIGAISAVAVGVLWTVFAMGSGDSPQRSAVAAGAGDLKPTNVDLMAPGAQVREVRGLGRPGRQEARAATRASATTSVASTANARRPRTT